MEEKQPFTASRVYPVVFMVAVTIVFVGVLAVFQQLTRQKVVEYRQFKDQATILRVFALPTGKDAYRLTPGEVAEVYGRCITRMKGTTPQTGYYLGRSENGDTLGYAYEIRGKGLWSTIEAIIALSSDRQKILRMEIVGESETPGLGARIEEPWFKKQFENKSLVRGDHPVTFTLVPEGDPVSPGDDRIAMITGATISTRAVTNMITSAISEIRSQGVGK